MAIGGVIHTTAKTSTWTAPPTTEAKSHHLKIESPSTSMKESHTSVPPMVSTASSSPSSPPHTPTSNPSTSNEVQVTKSSAVKQDHQRHKATPSLSKHKQKTQNCGKYGCNSNGSGVVAVIVVGVICFGIVLVVGAVVVKRVMDDRRKKRFRNVDYLINGMYT